MKNKPNMYRVTYLVMEGDNYAGGWGERTKDVKELGDLINVSRIQTVRPVYIEIGDIIDLADIDKATKKRKSEIEKQERINDVKRAEEQLKKAKLGLVT